MTKEEINNNLSLIAINYAFQKTFTWGGQSFVLKEKDLLEVRSLIDVDVEKTGKNLWSWFYVKYNKRFVIGYSYFNIGTEFFNHLENYYGD